MSSPDSHKGGETITGLEVVLYCRQPQPSKPQCLSCASLSGRRTRRWCALGATPNIVRQNLLTSSRVQIRFLKVAAQRVHSCTSTNGVLKGRWHSMILGLCEGAIAPGCQRPPSNFSGSFALQRPQRPGRRNRYLVRCDAMPTFRPLNNHRVSLILLLSPGSQEPILLGWELGQTTRPWNVGVSRGPISPIPSCSACLSLSITPPTRPTGYCV